MSYQVSPSAAAYYMANPTPFGAHGRADGPGAFLAGISPSYVGSSLAPRGLQYYSNVGAGRAALLGASVPARIGPLSVVVPAVTATSPY
jgi:hypothetical protein